jgi:hypothetical protein
LDKFNRKNAPDLHRSGYWDEFAPTGTAKIKVGNNTLAGGSYLNLQGASGSKTWFVASNYNIGGALEFIQSTANGGSTPAGTASMLIDSSGNVGIGTTSPSGKLQVKQANTAYGLVVEASGNDAWVRFHHNDSVGIVETTYNTSAGYTPLTFKTGGTERVRIDSAGNVGIGTSSITSGFKLDVLGDARFSDVAGDDGVELGWSAGGSAGFVQAYDRGASAFRDLSLNNAVTISSSGNVGIGTSSPDTSTKLTVAGAITVTGANSGHGASRLKLGQDNSAISQIRFYGADNSTAGILQFTGSSADGAVGAERARITSGGYFKASNSGTYVGLTSTYHELVQTAANTIAYFANTSATAGDNYGINISYRNADPNGTGNHFIYCEGDAVTQRMSVRSNGGIANYSANDVNLSDRREKTNFAPAKSYLDTICAIPVQTFNYIDQNMEEDPGLTLGVVAQDVQAVAPELVMESNWGTEEEPKMRLSIYQTDLQYALMKCIQEQQAIIEQLQADVATLKGTA